MKYYRLKFVRFPNGKYLSGWFLKRHTPEVLSCDSPDEALVFSEKAVNAFFELTLTEDHFEKEELDKNDPYFLY